MEWQNIIKSICSLGLPLLMLAPEISFAQVNPQVRISNLTDIDFGTIVNFSTDQTSSQSVCVYLNRTDLTYMVTATGSGAQGAFALASGSMQLPYEVRWAATPNQTNGTSLTAGVALPGLASDAKQSGCTGNPSTSASLIILLRTTTISAASSGTYTGTLTILISPS